MSSSRRRRIWLAAPAILGALGVSTTWVLWPGDPLDHTGEPARPPYLTIFLIDGLAEGVFQEELAEGRLPNLAQLISEGTYTPHGISAFPTMTGYGYYPIITGRDAAESGILGLRWFDRSRDDSNFRAYVGKTFVLMNHDLVERPATLFERAGAEHSSTINSYCNRGAHRGYNTGWMFTMAKYKQHWWLAGMLDSIPLLNSAVAPDWLVVEERVLELAVAELQLRPKIQWVTFVSPDTYTHVHGFGPRYPELIHKIDELIGRYRAASRTLGLEDDRVYAVLSDHGVEEVSQNLDLIAVMGARGISARRGNATRLLGSNEGEPLEALAELDAMIAINGNLLNHLYFRDPDLVGSAGWKSRPSRSELSAYRARGSTAAVDLVELFVNTPGIELTVLRGSAEEAEEVEVHTPRGVGRIRAGPERRTYSYAVSGEDPLRYTEDPAAAQLIGGAFAGERTWLKATHALDYPFAVPRLFRVMTSSAAPDVLVTSLPGYDLARDYELFVGNYRGGHGGLRASMIRVPYILAGPGIARGRTIEAALAEDVGATFFSVLGYEEPAVEGRSFRDLVQDPR